MADRTNEMQDHLDQQILEAQSGGLCKAAKAGFPVVLGLVGAASGTLDLGVTTVPGWLAGTAVGMVLAKGVCNMVAPIQHKADTISLGQALPRPKAHIVGIPSNMSTAQNLTPAQLESELRRLRATIRVHVETA